MNTIIEFLIFKLVYMLNFNLKLEFRNFRQNLPKKGISILNKKR